MQCELYELAGHKRRVISWWKERRKLGKQSDLAHSYMIARSSSRPLNLEQSFV